MKIGSIVETVGDFSEERKVWGLDYPYIGDVLTVSFIEEHPNDEVREAGIVLLHFEELPNLIGLCDRTYDNKPNFLELTLPDDLFEYLEVHDTSTSN